MADTIVYDATGETPNGVDASAADGGSTAFSFTTAASFSGALTDVKIDLGDPNPADGGTVTVYLYTDNPGSGPGTQIATLGSIADSSLGSTASLVDIPISSPINVSAGTRYWIKLVDSSSSATFVEYGNTGSGTGVANEYYWDGSAPQANTGGADIAQVTEDLSTDRVPVVTTTGGATAFVAGGSPTPVDSGVNVTDADNTTLASATVSITGNFQSGEDVLDFVNTSAATFGNIAANYDSSTGVLSLTSSGGTATVQQFKAALESVTYMDTATTPDSLTRTLSFIADDGIANSAAATKEITVADSASDHLVYDNTAIAATGTDPTFEHGAGSSAFSFTTAVGSAGTLADVKIDLGDATPGDGGAITAYLYSDSGGSGPLIELATIGSIADSSLGSTANYADFVISSTIDLSADTRYWIELVDSGNSGAFLAFDGSGAGTGVAGESYTYQGTVYSNSGGADLAQVTENAGSVDQVPVVTTTSGATAFVAGGSPTAVDSGVNVTDADNATLASATVSITGNFQSGEDVLNFVNNNATNFGNIAATYNSAAGVLSLTSSGDTATVQQFKAALEAVTYSDTAATPDSLTRTLSFVADDGVGNSAAATKDITVADSAADHFVYDNTSQAFKGEDQSFEHGVGSSAFSFTSAVGGAGTLVDVKMDLGDATPGDGGTITAYLYSDSGGSGPLTQLATIGSIADSSLPSTANFIDFAISSPIDLDAATRYWIEFVDSANSGAFLGYDSSNAGTGVAGESYTYQGAVDPNSGGADLAQVTENAPCYCRGARILTDNGEVAVEALRIGDRVVTASGDVRPIRWLGHRKLDCRAHRDPRGVWPVQIAAGAFGDGHPAHDLWLSPGHSVAVDGALIPIRCLVNGHSIAQVETERVEYWHVELEQHDILIADGLPAESYLDTGNRNAFTNGGAFIEAHLDFAPKHWRQTCLPIVKQGPEVAKAKKRLLARLFARGLELTRNASPHMLADGRRIEPIRLSEQRLAFALPEDCQSIALKSMTFIPAHTRAESEDERELGLYVARLEVDGDNVALDRDTGLHQGWYGAEVARGAFARRWTNGAASLPAGARLVIVDLAGHGYYWREPMNALVARRV